MICEKCGCETDFVTCSHCGASIRKLGSFCYLCGQKYETAVVVEEGQETDDFAARVLCSDGACIGVIGENGLCKVCGKPYVPETNA